METHAGRVSRVPPAADTLAQIGRGILLWLLVRVALMFVIGAGRLTDGTPLDPLVHLSAPQSLVLVAAVGILAVIDARVMRESLFYANLGVPQWFRTACAVAAAATLEVSARVLL